MPERDIKQSGDTVKYGIVYVFDGNRNVVRSYKISLAEHDEIISGKSRIPSGVTQEEWESGRASMVGYAADEGEYLVGLDGSLLVVLEDSEVDGKLVRKEVTVQPDAFSGKDSTLSLTKSVDLAGSKITSLSIVDGRAVWQ